LRQIDNFTQSIRSNPNEAEVFYRRGLSHQNLGDKEEAVADYSEAFI
jgi:tetratricopeptide (TPR) repeat protein